MELASIGIIAFILFGVVLYFTRLTLKSIMQDKNEQNKEDEV